MVTPEAIFRLAQVVTGGVRGGVIGDWCGKHDIQARGVGAALDFCAPVGVDLAGKINVKAHGHSSKVSWSVAPFYGKSFHINTGIIARAA